MPVRHNRQLIMIMLVILTFLGALPPSEIAAHGIDKTRGDITKGCLKNKDGTIDCSNIFIEVGEDQPTIMASCSGYGCDHQDPYAAGCAVSYGVIDMRYIYKNSEQLGYVQLWWSNTCQTNWARTVRTAANDSLHLEATVMRDDNGNRIVDASDGGDQEIVRLNGVTQVYTRMVYAPVRAALAQGHVIEPASGYNTWYAARTPWH